MASCFATSSHSWFDEPPISSCCNDRSSSRHQRLMMLQAFMQISCINKAISKLMDSRSDWVYFQLHMKSVESKLRILTRFSFSVVAQTSYAGPSVV
ncbi:unnamed protein product [Lathyrus oleraceus]